MKMSTPKNSQISMASKRMSIILNDSDREQQLFGDDLENCESISAKRFKSHGKSKHMETPVQRMLQRQVINNTCSLSPITELSMNMKSTILDGGTPKSSTLRTYNSVSSSCDSSNSVDSDEFMAIMELEALPLEPLPLDKLPDDMDALISGELMTTSDAEFSLIKRSSRRYLSMSQQDNLNDTPTRSVGSKPITRDVHRSKELPISKPLRKSVSMSNVDILNALNDEPQLIGDLSKPCSLPVLQNGMRHGDLKTISCDTLARLMKGEFPHLSDSYKIIDCRYPYEYDGGHIRGALNLYTRAQILDAFPTPAITKDDRAAGQRSIYVFHCEFSSERGPKLLRFLRSNDRSVHSQDYPTLSYPELYLLHNGYKEFFNCHDDLCVPAGYVPMLAPAHNEEYRLCRAKTKSWQCGSESDGVDSGIGGGSAAGDVVGSSSRSRTLYKSRSRLFCAE